MSKEDIIPYDRTLLSKALPSLTANDIPLRPAKFLSDADIDCKLNATVVSINSTAKKVALQGGEVLDYDKLCIATGSKVNKVSLPGNDLQGVHYLRSGADQAAIKIQAESASAIAINGSSWIATEVASALAGKYKGQKEIILIQSTEFPLERQLGPEVGALMAKDHTEGGVNIIAKDEITKINGSGGKVKSLTLKSGKEVNVDLVVFGKGVTPVTEFLADSGVELESDGGVTVNPFL